MTPSLFGNTSVASMPGLGMAPMAPHAMQPPAPLFGAPKAGYGSNYFGPPPAGALGRPPFGVGIGQIPGPSIGAFPPAMNPAMYSCPWGAQDASALHPATLAAVIDQVMANIAKTRGPPSATGAAVTTTEPEMASTLRRLEEQVSRYQEQVRRLEQEKREQDERFSRMEEQARKADERARRAEEELSDMRHALRRKQQEDGDQLTQLQQQIAQLHQQKSLHQQQQASLVQLQKQHADTMLQLEGLSKDVRLKRDDGEAYRRHDNDILAKLQQHQRSLEKLELQQTESDRIHKQLAEGLKRDIKQGVDDLELKISNCYTDAMRTMSTPTRLMQLHGMSQQQRRLSLPGQAWWGNSGTSGGNGGVISADSTMLSAGKADSAAPAPLLRRIGNISE